MNNSGNSDNNEDESASGPARKTARVAGDTETMGRGLDAFMRAHGANYPAETAQWRPVAKAGRNAFNDEFPGQALASAVLAGHPDRVQSIVATAMQQAAVSGTPQVLTRLLKSALLEVAKHEDEDAVRTLASLPALRPHFTNTMVFAALQKSMRTPQIGKHLLNRRRVRLALLESITQPGTPDTASALAYVREEQRIIYRDTSPSHDCVARCRFLEFVLTESTIAELVLQSATKGDIDGWLGSYDAACMDYKRWEFQSVTADFLEQVDDRYRRMGLFLTRLQPQLDRVGATIPQRLPYMVWVGQSRAFRFACVIIMAHQSVADEETVKAKLVEIYDPSLLSVTRWDTVQGWLRPEATFLYTFLHFMVGRKFEEYSRVDSTEVLASTENRVLTWLVQQHPEIARADYDDRNLNSAWDALYPDARSYNQNKRRFAEHWVGVLQAAGVGRPGTGVGAGAAGEGPGMGVGAGGAAEGPLHGGRRVRHTAVRRRRSRHARTRRRNRASKRSVPSRGA